jgi:hypothetical protein
LVETQEEMDELPEKNYLKVELKFYSLP